MGTFRPKRRFDIINYIPAIIATVLVAVILILLFVSLDNHERKVKMRDLKQMTVNIDRAVPFLRGVAYIDGENIYYVDDRNEKMWGFSGATEDMFLFSGKTRLACVTGKKLQIVNQKGDFAFSHEFDTNISSVSVGEKLIAVNLSNSDEMIVLNGTGEEIDRITSETDCTNIRYGVFSDESIWVITVENSGYVPKYRLSTYKYDTEKRQTVTFEVDNQMIYSAVFYENLCYIFGTDDVMVRDCNYTDTVKIDYAINGYDVSDYKRIGKNLNVLLLNNGNLKCIGKDGLKTVKCEEKINHAFILGKNYYGFSDYFMYKFSPDSLKGTKYRLPIKAEKIIDGEDFVLIISDNKMYRYQP